MKAFSSEIHDDKCTGKAKYNNFFSNVQILNYELITIYNKINFFILKSINKVSAN